MADENSSEQPPPNSPDGMESSLISEEELDEVLAQATSLAADLSEEVGVADEPATPSRRSVEAAASDATPPGVDDELAELERLVGEAKQDIDEPAEEPAPEAPPAETPTAPAAAPPDEPESTSDPETDSATDLSVPDFMSEFTESEEPAAPAPEKKTSADSAVQGSPETGVVGTGKIGVVGTPDVAERDSPAEAIGTAELPGDRQTADPKPQAEDRKPQAVKAFVSKILQPLVQRGAPLARTACDRAVGCLEAIDRRTGFVGDGVRQILGWVAIATIGTSVLVYLFTMS